MKGRYSSIAVAMFSALVGLGTAELAQADAWEFQDTNCRELLEEHPGSFPAHAAGHSRANETALEEVQRTGKRARYHQKITYWALDQVKDCLRSLSHSLGADAQRRNYGLEDLQERQKRIEDKLDDILSILRR